MSLALFVSGFRLLNKWFKVRASRELVHKELIPVTHVVADFTATAVPPSLTSTLLLPSSPLPLRSPTLHSSSSSNRTWMAATLAGSSFLLLPADRRIDLMLTALVRAMDALVADAFRKQLWITRYCPSFLRENGDGIVFVAACTEIISSWFYTPESLPKAYIQWITAMSELDHRLLKVLRWLRNGMVVYGKTTGLGLESYLDEYCRHHRLPETMGNPSYGFIGCQVVHPGRGCLENSTLRWWNGFQRGFRVGLIGRMNGFYFRRFMPSCIWYRSC